MDQATTHLSGVESMILTLLHPDNRWMVLLFHICNEVFWFGVPALLVFYILCYLKGCVLFHNTQGEKHEFWPFGLAINQHADLLNHALEDPGHIIHQAIEKRVSETVQAGKQDAIEACIVQSTKLSQDEIFRIEQKHTSLIEDLFIAQERNTLLQESLVNAEDRVASLEGQMQEFRLQLRGELSEAHSKLITKYVSSIATKIITDADQDRFRKLALTTTNPDHELLKRLHEKFIEGNLDGLPSKVSELRDEMRQQKERFRSVINKQGEAIIEITSTYRTPTVIGTEAEDLSKLKDRVDSHDTQLQGLIKISADVNEVDAQLKTFTELHTQPKATTDALSMMQIKLKEHDIQFEKLGGIENAVDTLGTQHEQHKGKTERIETTLATRENKLMKQIKIKEVLETRMEKLESTITAHHVSVAANSESIKKLEMDVKSHVVELNELRKYTSDDDSDIKDLRGKFDLLEEEVESIKSSVADLEGKNLETVEAIDTINGHIEGHVKELKQLQDDAGIDFQDIKRLKEYSRSDYQDIKKLKKYTNIPSDFSIVANNASDAASPSSPVVSPTSPVESLTSPTLPASPASGSSSEGVQHHSAATGTNGQEREGADTSQNCNQASFIDTGGIEPLQAPPLPALSALPMEGITTPPHSAFDASLYQDITVNFSPPSDDSPLATLGDGTPPHIPMQYSSKFVSDAFPAPFLSEISEVAPPMLMEGTEEWQTYAQPGQSFDDYLDSGMDIDRDNDDQLSDRDAEGESDFEDAVYGNGY